MDHQDHVRLLQKGIPGPGGVWADFGSGSGAFTLALAELLTPGGTVHAIDRDGSALKQLQRRMHARFPQVNLHTHVADYTQLIDLSPLDGIVMANALHFQREKQPVVQLLRSYLRPGGRLVLVEYDTNRGNRWVPHPMSYEDWERLAGDCGFHRTERIATQPSRFLGQFYSALSIKPH